MCLIILLARIACYRYADSEPFVFAFGPSALEEKRVKNSYEKTPHYCVEKRISQTMILYQGCPTRFNCGPHWLPQYFGEPHGPIYKSQIYSTPSMNAIEMWLRNCS